MLFHQTSTAWVINLEDGSIDYQGSCRSILADVNVYATLTYATGTYNLNYYSRNGGHYLIYEKHGSNERNLDVVVGADELLFHVGNAEGYADCKALIREI